ncbi:unnamed protein product [Peronospora belbahrii]|uniref:RNase H type-1 domain-containing protein n=1 Tax=Peronospora belbahrii TaxID=622444 RepID=A0AAU9L4V9_9STRA|nr:unnamed protein product [Peronospora belbahrii]
MCPPVKQGDGACSAIAWRFPDCTIVKAASKFLVTSTVNEAEYEGTLLSFDLLEPLERRRLIICGDSSLGVRQMRGEIECKAAGLSPLQARALNKLLAWPTQGIVHVKRDCNQSADHLASTALRQKEGIKSIPEGEWPNLEGINRLSELLVPTDQRSAKVLAITRSQPPIKMSGEIRQEGVIQRLRTDQIREVQGQEDWVRDLKAYLKGDWVDLPTETAHSCKGRGRRPRGNGQTSDTRKSPSRRPAPLPHQSGRRSPRGWAYLSPNPTVLPLERFIPKRTERNYRVTNLDRTVTGYVMAKASASRTAQTVDEGRMVGQRQQATMAYRPQANETAEIMVQNLTRSIKMYVSDVGQQDWDEYAERLMFAMNTAQDRVRKETPFYLDHGWDARTTFEATLTVVNTRRRGSGPRRWRYHIQQHYQRARAQVNENLRAASQARILAHNEGVVDHKIQPGTQVWLYLDRVKERYAKKCPTSGMDHFEF